MKKTVEDEEQGIGVVISTNQQYAVCEGHMHKAWVTLHPDDKTDLEARLTRHAELMGKQFALLC